MIYFTIRPDCSVEKLILPAQATLEYVFNSTRKDVNLEVFTPTYENCPVNYTLYYRNPDANSNVTWTDLSLLSDFFNYTNDTHSATFYYDIDNRYSILPTENLYEMNITGCTWGMVCNSTTFNLNIIKDCEWARLSSIEVDKNEIFYTISKPVVELTILKPQILNEQYCTFDYQINVLDNITQTSQPYNTKFGLDTSSSTVHPDGVMRSESFILQNVSTSNSTHLFLRIYSSTTDFGDLNMYVTDDSHDYYNYTVTIRAFIRGQEPVINGTRDSVEDQFWFVLKAYCDGLQLNPPAIPDLEYSIWETTKSVTLPRFTITWDWVDPVVPLSDTSLVTETQVLEACGAWDLRIYN